jgi:predicted LPLAT superfamily acyltransferase
MSPGTTTGTRWQDVAEKGTILGIRVVVVVATTLGRRAVRALLHVVAAWYVVFHPGVRRASRAYLARLHGRASLGDVYRHVLCFARVTADRVFLARAALGRFTLEIEGEPYLRALQRDRRGALLILAHVGSFEILRAAGTVRDVPVNFLGYFRNARMINAVLRELNPAVDARLVEIRPNDPTFIFDVERLVAGGELVGTMGDRVGADGKAVEVPFLGAPAAFPTGPYLLAAALGCPVYLGFGLYHEPNRYALYCEPFAERVVLPRATRAEAVRDHVARYAARLEHFCRLAPYNWFNFYDFWSAR